MRLITTDYMADATDDYVADAADYFLGWQFLCRRAQFGLWRPELAADRRQRLSRRLKPLAGKLIYVNVSVSSADHKVSDVPAYSLPPWLALPPRWITA
jgi:hypothetical protein